MSYIGIVAYGRSVLGSLSFPLQENPLLSTEYFVGENDILLVLQNCDEIINGKINYWYLRCLAGKSFPTEYIILIVNLQPIYHHHHHLHLHLDFYHHHHHHHNMLSTSAISTKYFVGESDLSRTVKYNITGKVHL